MGRDVCVISKHGRDEFLCVRSQHNKLNIFIRKESPNLSTMQSDLNMRQVINLMRDRRHVNAFLVYQSLYARMSISQKEAYRARTDGVPTNKNYIKEIIRLSEQQPLYSHLTMFAISRSYYLRVYSRVYPNSLVIATVSRE